MASTGGGSLSRLLVLGVLFHAAYVLSIFDIYFKSPVVPHIESAPYAEASLRAPARRVVVFVADGCRADKFFEANASLIQTPNEDHQRVTFLRRVMLEQGSYGVSHTRVPTESRPGHVALFAGMYEDVSAVTKGWQDNPVDFDSVFNQSQHAFLFGSPDIVPMFARNVEHATEWHYSHEEEDFAKADSSELDVWVFHQLQALMARAGTNATLNAELRGDNVVFFCHFLGIDSNGHAHRPNSPDYLNNIALVDELVEKTYRLLEDFYDYDGQTAYVFTADHGMSLKGAHGDGDPANTRTPLVAWGAGVQGPTTARTETSAETFDIDLPTQSRAQVQAQLQAQQPQELAAATEWGKLAGLVRKDVMQADVAPLISSLLGLPYPRNSVGVLPFSFLAKGKYRAKAVMFNAQQLYLHALRKEQEKEARTLLYFQPYRPFRELVPSLARRIQETWNRDDAEDYYEVEATSQEMIEVCLATLEYFQRYDWFFLLSVIVIGYVGWIFVITIAYLHPSSFRLRSLADQADIKLWFAVFAVFAYLALESSPATYYLYVSFPIVYWNFVWNHRRLLPPLSVFGGHDGFAKAKWLEVVLILVSLELVVVGYERRAIFGVLFTMLAGWSLVENKMNTGDNADDSRAAWKSTVYWSGSCLFLSVFPYLPSEYGEHTSLVLIGGAVVIAFPYLVDRYFARIEDAMFRQNSRGASSWTISSVPLVLSLIALYLTMDFLDSKSKPPVLLTVANWLLAIGPIVAMITRLASSKPASTDKRATDESQAQVSIDRLVQVMLAFAPSFVLLSISYEVFFYVALCCVLVAWVEREAASATQRIHQRTVPASTVSGDSTGMSEVHRAFLFLLLVNIAFFGTGNVASMSSFEISSTYRFVTVFSPFTMGALLVGKILIPFMIVACAFHLILGLQPPPRLAPSRYFLLVVGMSDVLALHFLFLVRNEGSWKEIGNSISMFGIVNAFIVFIPLLFLLAKTFVRDLTHDDAVSYDDKKRF